jgi:hypothetical protein
MDPIRSFNDEIRHCLIQKMPLISISNLEARAPSLQHLDLSGIAVNAAQLEKCTALFTALTHLKLQQCNLDDDACIPLSRLTLLEELDISQNAAIEGGFVQHLPPSLKKLTAYRVRIPPRMLNALWERFRTFTLSQ